MHNLLGDHDCFRVGNVLLPSYGFHDRFRNGLLLVVLDFNWLFAGFIHGTRCLDRNLADTFLADPTLLLDWYLASDGFGNWTLYCVGNFTHLCCRNHSCGLNWYFLRDHLRLHSLNLNRYLLRHDFRLHGLYLNRYLYLLRLRDVTGGCNLLGYQIRAVAVLGPDGRWCGLRSPNESTVVPVRVTRVTE